MALDYSSPEHAPRRRSFFEIALLLGFILCLLIGAGALAGLYLLRESQETGLTRLPLAERVPDGIVPQVALLQLAGDPTTALAAQSLTAGELDTAYATLLFDPVSSGSRRTGLALQLAAKYGDDEPNSAAHLFQLASSTAILSSDMAPLERGQALVRAADGLLKLELQPASLDSAIQAKLMGEQLPDLLPAQRSQLCRALQPLADDLEDDLFSRQVDELARNPFLTPGGVLITPRWQTLGSPVAPEPALTEAIAQRRFTARQLADRYALTAGTDVEPERQALETALRQEDAVRSEYYRRLLVGQVSLPEQFHLVQDRRDWAVLKSRIALGGYGLSLIPEWEANAPAILQELSAATAAIDVVAKGLAAVQPTALEQANLSLEVLNWLALQAELGLYPDAPVADLNIRITATQNDLNNQGEIVALPLLRDETVVPPGFRIQSRPAIQP